MTFIRSKKHNRITIFMFCRSVTALTQMGILLLSLVFSVESSRVNYHKNVLSMEIVWSHLVSLKEAKKKLSAQRDTASRRQWMKEENHAVFLLFSPKRRNNHSFIGNWTWIASWRNNEEFKPTIRLIECSDSYEIKMPLGATESQH